MPLRDYHPTFGHIAINARELCQSLTRTSPFTEPNLRELLTTLGCELHTYNVVYVARKCVGMPYRRNCTERALPKAFDCSSFVQYVYALLGVYLPRYTNWQARAGDDVTAEPRKAGDLVFMPNHRGWQGETSLRIGHVALATENGKCLHTDNVKQKCVVEVEEEKLQGPIITVRRLLPHPEMVAVVRLSTALIRARVFTAENLEERLRKLLNDQSHS